MIKRMLIAGMLCTAMLAQAQDMITLSPATRTGGKPLMEALDARKSDRNFVKKEMNPQMLSDLLWAANGFNRPDKRTAPTARDRQEIEIYVMFDHGVYFYDAKANQLTLVNKGNFIDALGQANISKSAAVSLILVADSEKAVSRELTLINAGYISQNVYLYAASAGLGTVARASFNKAPLSKALKLSSRQEVILVQPVGFLK